MHLSYQPIEYGNPFDAVPIDENPHSSALAAPHSCSYCSRILLYLEAAWKITGLVLALEYSSTRQVVRAFRKCPFIRQTWVRSQAFKADHELEQEELVALFLPKKGHTKWYRALAWIVRGGYFERGKPGLCQLWVEFFSDVPAVPSAPYTNTYQCRFEWSVRGCDNECRRNFLMYAEHDTPAALFVASRPIQRSAECSWSITLAREWFEECQHSHPRCRFLRPKAFPKRVIHVGENDRDAQPSLSINPPSDVQYAALSYCWGPDDDQALKTTKASLSSMCQRIPLSKLPKTVLDAFTVCRQLKVRYIWVDRLCIVQDDIEDKTSEMGRMATIFQNAVVTICAASAKSCNDGFLGERKPYSCSRGNPARVRCVTGHGNVESVMLEPLDRTRGLEESEPVQKRSWTVQEYLLSSRILYYGTCQLRWICRTTQYIDGGQSSHQTRMPQLGIRPDTTTLWDQWHGIVADYTRRSLTHAEDKLPALSGVAEMYSVSFKDAHNIELKYYAGIWSHHFILHLLWYVDEQKRYPKPEYRAPTWSWASVDGPISINLAKVLKDLDDHLRISAIDVQVASSTNPFGAVKAGFIKCKGLIQTGSLTRLHWTGKEFSIKSALGTLIALIHFDSWNGMDEMPDALKEVCCLVLLRTKDSVCRGLVLKAVDNQNCFQRIGMWCSWGEEEYKEFPANPEWLQGCELRELEII